MRVWCEPKPFEELFFQLLESKCQLLHSFLLKDAEEVAGTFQKVSLDVGRGVLGTLGGELGGAAWRVEGSRLSFETRQAPAGCHLPAQ